MNFFCNKALVNCLLLILLQFGSVLFAKPPVFDPEVQEEFGRIKQSRESLNNAYYGATSVPQEIVDYFKLIESSPDLLREAIKDSAKDPNAYKFFLLEIAESKVVAYQQSTNKANNSDELRVKYALAFLAALRHPMQIGHGDFHSEVLQRFRTKILVNLNSDLQVNVKMSLAQYIRNPQARSVALPAMIFIAEVEGVINYLASITADDSTQMIELVLLALSKNIHLDVLRDQPVFQNFLINQIQSESPNVRRLALRLLIQRNRGGLISSHFENNLLTLIADPEAASDARISSLRVLTSNHERKWFNVNDDLANEAIIVRLKDVYAAETKAVEVKRAILKYFVARKSGNELALKFLIGVAMKEQDVDSSKLAFDALGANSKQHFEKRLYEDSVIEYLISLIRTLANDPLTSKKIRRIEMAANLVAKNSPKTFGGQLELYLAASQVQLARGRLDEKSDLVWKRKNAELNLAIESLDYSYLALLSASRNKISSSLNIILDSERISVLNQTLEKLLAETTSESPQLVYDAKTEEVVRDLLNNLSLKQIEQLMQLEGLDKVKFQTYLLRFHKSSETLLIRILKNPKLFDATLAKVIIQNKEILKSVINALNVKNIRLNQDHVQILVGIMKKLPELSDQDTSLVKDFTIVIKRFRASPQRLAEFPIYSQDLAEVMWELANSEDLRLQGLKQIILDLKDRLSNKRIGFSGSACALTWLD